MFAQVVSFFFLPLYFAVAVTYVLWIGVFTIGSNYVYVCIVHASVSLAHESFSLYVCMYVCSLRGSTAATRHWSSTVWSTPSVLWYAIALCTLFTAVFFGVSAISYVHYVLGRVYSL